jgi:hypothetical protein
MLSFLYCSDSSEYLQVVVDAILSSSDQARIFGIWSKKKTTVDTQTEITCFKTCNYLLGFILFG